MVYYVLVVLCLPTLGGNAVASVCPFPLLLNQVTFDLDLLHAYESWP